MLLRKIAVARFCRTLATLTSSGVPILDGLEITAKTAGNAIIEDAIMAVRKASRRARRSPSRSAETKVFPPMVVQMINVGEQTGALDQMLSKIADFYEDEVDTAVAGLMKLIEPLHDHRPRRHHRHHRRRHVPAALLDPAARSGSGGERSRGTAGGRRLRRRDAAEADAQPTAPLVHRLRLRAAIAGDAAAARLAAAGCSAVQLGGDRQSAWWSSQRPAAQFLRRRAAARAELLQLRARSSCSPASPTSPRLLYLALLRLLRRRPTAQAYIQFFGDLLLITGLVYYFGGIASPFSMLYLIVIAVAVDAAAPARRHDRRQRRLRALRQPDPRRSTSDWLPPPSRAPPDQVVGLPPGLQPGGPLLRLLRRRPPHLLPGAERRPRRARAGGEDASTSPTCRSSTATSSSRSPAA